jgi:CheY-like chemotaxis protein
MKTKILYADDDETSRLSIARLLQQEGYECVAVCDGVAGGQALREQEFDCVISDLKMQGNANMEFIRAVPRLCPGVPVIVVTGYPSLETAVASLQLPVTAYLLKPLDFTDLLKQVRVALLGRALLRQVEHMRANVNNWLADLTQMAEGLRRAPRTPLETPMAVFMAITYRNVLDSLLCLKTVMECSLPTQPQTAQNGSRAGGPLLLIEALRDAIDVLEKTKDAFRSRELGDLRHRLEDLLQVAKTPSQDGRS